MDALDTATAGCQLPCHPIADDAAAVSKTEAASLIIIHLNDLEARTRPWCRGSISCSGRLGCEVDGADAWLMCDSTKSVWWLQLWQDYP